MKKEWFKRAISLVLAVVMAACLASVPKVSVLASAFGAGQMALAGIGGLILGILGATLVLKKKRREDEPETV